MRIIGVTAALLIVAVAGSAAAQSDTDQDVPPPPVDYEFPDSAPSGEAGLMEPSSGPIEWSPPGPNIRDGVRDPVYGAEPDDGVTWNGAMFFLAFYLNGVATTLPFGLVGCCGGESWSVFAFIPFAQWAVAFGGGGSASIGGGLFALLEIVATIVFAAGLSHHHPALRSGRQAGDVNLSRGGVEIAF